MGDSYSKIAGFCVALTDGAPRVPEVERQLFGGWSTLVHLFRMPTVQAAAADAFDEIAAFMQAVVSDALVPSVDDDSENDWNAENRVGGIVKGLAHRAADDCSAISLLLVNDRVRQAAGLCRSLYEALGWMDLLLDGEGGEKASLLYEFFNTKAGLDAQVDVMGHRAAMMDIARTLLRDDEVVPLLPSILHQHAVAYQETVKAEVDRLRDAVPAGVKGRWKRPPNCYLKVAKYFDAANAHRYTSLWSATIYYPSCRILHAADALDYVDLYDRGGVVAEVEPGKLPAAVGSPEGILAATAYRTVLSLPALHEWMKDFFWDDDDAEEERREATLEASRVMTAVAYVLGGYIGPVVEK